jgi:hypothetical protein
MFLLVAMALGCGTELTEDYTIEISPSAIDLVSGRLNDNDDDTTVDFPIRVFVFDDVEAPVNQYSLTISSLAAYGQVFSEGADIDFVQVLQNDGETLCSAPCSVQTDGEGKADLFVRVNHVDQVTDTFAFAIQASNQALSGNLTVTISFE